MTPGRCDSSANGSILTNLRICQSASNPMSGLLGGEWAVVWIVLLSWSEYGAQLLGERLESFFAIPRQLRRVGTFGDFLPKDSLSDAIFDLREPLQEVLRPLLRFVAVLVKVFHVL